MSNVEEIPPGTELIDTIRAEKSPYHSWAGEVVDNAFDAGASIVRLTMSADRLEARDNGNGVTKQNDQAIVKIAGHGEMPGTRLGRFGVGIKYKSIQHGNIYQIDSVSKDGRLKRRVNWQEMRRSGRWLYPPAARTSVPADALTGTTITIQDLITKPPSKKDIDKTISEISRRYYPALESGGSITVNSETIAPIVQPILRDVIEVTLSFPGGRSAQVRGGMLVDPSGSKLRQVDICVDYRVIKPESAFACDGYGGIRSMYVRIDLNRPWKLTKFKDDIAEDPYQDDLEAAVEEAIRPLLEQCQSASMVLKTKALEQILNEMLPEDHRMSRPIQKQKLDREGQKRGDKKPKDLDQSTQSPSGPARKRKPPRGIVIEFADGLNDTHGFGRAQSGKSSTRIQLASDNPYIAILMNSRDQQQAAIGLYGIAVLLYEGDLQMAAPRLLDDPIGLRAWRIASKQELPEAA